MERIEVLDDWGGRIPEGPPAAFVGFTIVETIATMARMVEERGTSMMMMTMTNAITIL